MGRWVGQKVVQKIGYPLWMAPIYLKVTFIHVLFTQRYYHYCSTKVP